MLFTKELAIGAVLSTLTGGLVGLGGWGAETPSIVVSVPIGKVGDALVYSFSLVDLLPDVGDPADESRQHFVRHKLVSLDRTIDAFGIPHRTVRLVSDDRTPDGRDWQNVHDITLRTRDVIRSYGAYPIKPGNFVTALRGPLDNGQPLIGNHSLLRYQGGTFRPGDEIDLRGQYPFGYQFLVSRPLEDVEYRSWVNRTGVIDGRPAVGVETRLGAYYYVRNVATLAGARYRAELRQVEWLVEGVPYPVRIEVEERDAPADRGLGPDDDAYHYQSVAVLRSFEEGATPVPWGDCESEAHFRTSNPDLERGPASQAHPADGTGSSLRFPLGKALAAVHEDTTLARFQTWKRDTPGAALVGALLRRGLERPPYAPDQAHRLTAADVDVWHLLFAGPSSPGKPGTGFAVVARRDANTTLVTTAEVGTFKLPLGAQFRSEELVGPHITLGAAEGALAARDEGSLTSRSPDFVHWGMEWRRGQPELQEDPVVITGSKRQLTRLSMGNLENGIQPSVERPANPTVLSLSYGVLNSSSGRIGQLYQFKSWYSEVTSGIRRSTGGLALAPEPATTADVTHPAPVESSLLLGSAFLAGFLVAYFLPLLKYFGGRLFGFFAGYAKLRRADLLGNEFRQNLHRLIDAEPGITPPELHKQLGGGWSTIVYHLHVLEKNKLVSSLLDGRHKRFFPVDKVNWSERASLAALRNERTRQFYETLREEPHLTRRALARRMNLSVPTVMWHLDRLERGGLAAHDRDGRRFLYYARQTAPGARPPPLSSGGIPA